MKQKAVPERQLKIIDSPAIRIILLKTVVGYERQVSRAFGNFLDKNKKEYDIEDWWAYKVFGEYDICFIIKRQMFEQDMAYAGTIEGIVYSTELLCYLWGREGQRKQFEKRYFDKPLIFINILKLKPPVIKETKIKVESAVSELLGKFPDIFCLGSFGWGEFVVMYPSSKFDDLQKNFIDTTLSYAMITENQELISLFLKPFLLVGINYNLLNPKIDCTTLSDQMIQDKLYPSVSVSCRPSEIELKQRDFFRAMKMPQVETRQTSLTYGIFDFILPIKGITWGEFIERLIRFREANKAAIFKTSVQISGIYDLPSKFKFKRMWKFSPMCIKISKKHIAKLGNLGHPVQESILATIYTFNQYMQNELLSDCIEDMIDYVIMTINLLEEVDVNNRSGENKEVLQLLENLPESIRYGCNQRLSGFLLQEGTEDFSPFKGGKQRLLKALKSVCKDIFEGIGIKWPGYVVIGKQYNYHHSYKILSIPVNYAFNVDQYWGLFHEICHVIILTEDNIFQESFTTSEEKELLQQIGKISREIYCDLFDYQCGFLGDYDLYRNTVPAYLASQIKSLSEIEGYLLRFLCVTCYHKAKNRETFRINDSELERISSLIIRFFNEAIKHSDILDEYQSNLNQLKQKIMNSYEQMIFVLESFKNYYDEKLVSFCTDRQAELKSSTFNDTFKNIMKGQIASIQHPQLIILAMLRKRAKGRNIPFNANVAAIQSFLNCYYEHDWDGLYFPYSVVSERKNQMPKTK